MSDQHQTILNIIATAYRCTGAPVTTIDVATRYGMCDRHMRRYLASLERMGKVKRVGQRRGWELPLSA